MLPSNYFVYNWTVNSYNHFSINSLLLLSSSKVKVKVKRVFKHYSSLLTTKM